MSKNFFPSRPEFNPKIYAYTEYGRDFDGLIKIGYTERDGRKNERAFSNKRSKEY